MPRGFSLPAVLHRRYCVGHQTHNGDNQTRNKRSHQSHLLPSGDRHTKFQNQKRERCLEINNLSFRGGAIAINLMEEFPMVTSKTTRKKLPYPRRITFITPGRVALLKARPASDNGNSSEIISDT